MSDMLTATEKMVDMLKFVPLGIKQPAAKLAYGFLGDKIFSNTLSNLGVVTLPHPVCQQIDSFDFVLGTAITNRAGCAMITFENTATLSVTKMTTDPTFEEALFDLLRADQIDVKTEESGFYED